jgi:hypothetical protein
MVWLSTEEIIKKVPCTCVDGRTQGMRFSAAGGSIGLILHILSDIEAEQKTTLSEKSIRHLLENIADQIGPVYFHTDQHAVDRIYARLGFDEHTKLRSMTTDQQRSFLELATKSDFQGCGHIKLMLHQVADYKSNPILIEKILRQFLKLFFEEKNNILFDVLNGEHEEEKIFIVEHQPDLSEKNETALYFEDKNQENQFFCHRPLKKELFRRLADLLNELNIANFNGEDINRLTAKHNEQAEVTLSHIAGNLGIQKINL